MVLSLHLQNPTEFVGLSLKTWEDPNFGLPFSVFHKAERKFRLLKTRILALQRVEKPIIRSNPQIRFAFILHYSTKRDNFDPFWPFQCESLTHISNSVSKSEGTRILALQKTDPNFGFAEEYRRVQSCFAPMRERASTRCMHENNHHCFSCQIYEAKRRRTSNTCKEEEGLLGPLVAIFRLFFIPASELKEVTHAFRPVTSEATCLKNTKICWLSHRTVACLGFRKK